jgi:hypothetical protein
MKALSQATFGSLIQAKDHHWGQVGTGSIDAGADRAGPRSEMTARHFPEPTTDLPDNEETDDAPLFFASS